MLSYGGKGGEQGMPDFLNFMQYRVFPLMLNWTAFEKPDFELPLLPVPQTYRIPIFDKRDSIRTRKQAICARGK